MSGLVAETKERGIIMTGDSVRAILDGRKTQTRRVIQPQPPSDYAHLEVGNYHPTIVVRGEEAPGDETFGAWSSDGEFAVRCRYGVVGDRLWVKEKWHRAVAGRPIRYHATDEYASAEDGMGWTSPVLMPRAASRLTLEITGVRCERVQNISSADACAEGVRPAGVSEHAGDGTHDEGDPETATLDEFRRLWETLNAKRGYSWESNPWVWVISFAQAA